MINKHEFQQAAKAFRAGRLSLEQFTRKLFDSATSQPASPTFSARPRDAHKGDFGKLLLIGGSRGMEGAISLSALGALRAGAGLVKVAVPDEIRSIVASHNPCLMTIGCHSKNGMLSDRWHEELASAIGWADLIAIGPGLGRGESVAQMVDQLYRESKLPMVIDADGLNAIADVSTDMSQHAGPRILTPHVGEFCRLVPSLKMNSREELEQAATEIARSAAVIMVLKGANTMITDGTNTFHNQTGNPGMATAGSGDVLTGIIAALVATQVGINDAACDRARGVAGDLLSDDNVDAEIQLLQRVRMAVHCHGLAADLAIKKIPPTSLMATDLLDFLPSAIGQMT